MIDKYNSAIEIELFLSIYSDFQFGKYKSSQGLIDISAMTDIHLQNSLNALRLRRELRFNTIMNLFHNPGDVMDHVKYTYLNNEDLLSLKIQELEQESKRRGL